MRIILMIDEKKSPSIVKQKVQQLKETIRASRPYATDIEVTAEEKTFSWKSPPGFGWSKTNDLKIAIHGSTKRLHAVITSGTGELYFYK